MDTMHLQLGLLLLLQFLLNALQMIGSQPGSDHNYHLGLIRGIRQNGRRFVRSYPNTVGERYFAYPQFYHWILSFAPYDMVTRHYGAFESAISIIQLICFWAFAYTIYPFVDTYMEVDRFILFGSLIFIFTPFSYAIWNAKNTGIGARGFGLLLGQIYLYFIAWYLLYGNVSFLLSTFFLGFVIIISSQFAMQFVLLSAPLFALIFRNPLFLLIPVFALLLFYVTMPNCASSFIRGQINHKTTYYRYLADKFILRERYSIWRDFVYDFWVKAGSDFQMFFLYVYHNPLVSVLLGFPFLTLYAYHCLVDGDVRGAVLSNEGVFCMAVAVGVSLLAFLLTSSRKTRFLGEPQRYVEFAIPQISILGVIILSHSRSVAYVVLLMSFALVVGQFVMHRLRDRYGISQELNETMGKILETLCTIGGSESGEMRLFSNNVNINKMLLVGNWKVLNISLFSPYTGRIHFKDAFPVEYPNITQEVILPLIREFEIGWFVLDTSTMPDYDGIMEDNALLLREERTIDNCKIFRVCSKSS